MRSARPRCTCWRVTQGSLTEERTTGAIIAAFYAVYRTLGFGFLEHVYVMALERELRKRGHVVAREISVDVFYDGEQLCTQRLDMIVDDRVVVETKATWQSIPEHIASFTTTFAPRTSKSGCFSISDASRSFPAVLPKPPNRPSQHLPLGTAALKQAPHLPGPASGRAGTAGPPFDFV